MLANILLYIPQRCLRARSFARSRLRSRNKYCTMLIYILYGQPEEARQKNSPSPASWRPRSPSDLSRYEIYIYNVYNIYTGHSLRKGELS